MMVEATEKTEPDGVPAPTPDDPASGDQPAMEPIEFVPSRKKWWVMIIGATAFAGGVLLSFGGSTGAVFFAAFSSILAAIGAIMLVPGANSLQLDRDGFRVTHFFRAKSFRWSDVSEFGVCSFGQSGEVVAFKAAEARLNIWEKLNAAFLGEKNAYLPDTYGMSAENLAQLMNTRLNLATRLPESR